MYSLGHLVGLWGQARLAGGGGVLTVVLLHCHFHRSFLHILQKPPSFKGSAVLPHSFVGWLGCVHTDNKLFGLF